MNDIFDVIVIGAGQSGLACGYYLRKTKLNFLLLDANTTCGGAWANNWDKLQLFSAASHSSLPGWQMPTKKNEYPTKKEVISYLCQYENRYSLPIKRTVNIKNVNYRDQLFELEANNGEIYKAKTIIAATGTQSSPYIPKIKGKEIFKGQQLHSSSYKNPNIYKDKSVLVVGEGNSAAQILAQVSKVTSVFWAVKNKPAFLPANVDGKDLFDQATAKYKAKKEGKEYNSKNYNLNSIVMVPNVKEAYERNVYKEYNTIAGFSENHVIWQDGTSTKIDVVIWATGFNFTTNYLRNLVSVNPNGKIETIGTSAKQQSGLWLVGFGQWTGYASATLIGVGRSARKTIKEIQDFLNS
ncbi:ArsO family NAD(P)H-dependent flavin-containing monooxygenase [Zunongwangia sp.]|uniref:ArsO family NAD(P)H-dependent flavin-containing monooxygenase n=1 Tax=Zunongwangia sp. TaxID=1965325 RepID=UPI003AA867EC